MAEFSVTQLNDYVSKLLARDVMLKNITLIGELSGFKRHSSGHLYFTLKDETSLIRCVMFRQSAMSIRFAPKDGMQLILRGYVALYARDGQYQFYVQAMERAGEGILYQRFIETKNHLQAEGLFDLAHKRELPFLPRAVGVVTSATGAVIKDIRNVLWRRFPGMEIVLYPAKVQGDGAADEIVRGILALCNYGGVDVIIIGRGGGSIEDLWAFNEERVARAIYGSTVPVVSAVGHETDFTIADFTADLRAPTPSAAAELCVPVKTELQQALYQIKERIYAAETRYIESRHAYVLSRRESGVFMQPRLMLVKARHMLEELDRKLRTNTAYALENRRNQLINYVIRLENVNPASVLKRGYAIVNIGKTTVRSITQLEVGDDIRLTFADGCALAKVNETKAGE
jgi:exodeoxyribonuclease VII large subunit